MKLQISQEGAIAQLKDFFSHKTVFASEALQNARRAGASSFKVMTSPSNMGGIDIEFHDNGKGFDQADWLSVLQVFKSGWSASIQSDEYAYGFGFASLIFSCKQLSLVSNDYSWSFSTDDAIQGCELGKPAKSNSFVSGTKVILKGVNMDGETIEGELSSLARTSSLSVYHNDVKLKNDKCPDALLESGFQHIETDVGDLYIDWENFLSPSPYDSPAFLSTRSNTPAENTTIVCQEAVVKCGGAAEINRAAAFVFANSSLKARLPDRDKLIDEDDAMVRLETIYSDLISSKLAAERVALNDDITFIEKYGSWLREYAPALFNSIDVVPASYFECVEPLDLVEECQLNVNYRDIINAAVSRIGERGVHRNSDLLIIEDYAAYDTFPHCILYLANLGAIRLVAKLPADHWIYELVKPVPNHVSVTVDDVDPHQRLAAYGSGAIAGSIILRCDGLPDVTVTGGALVLPEWYLCKDIHVSGNMSLHDSLCEQMGEDYPIVLFPHELIDSTEPGRALRTVAYEAIVQQNSFHTEYNDFLQDNLEEQVDALVTDLKAVKGVGLDTEITNALKRLPDAFLRALANKDIKVLVDEAGAVEVSVAA